VHKVPATIRSRCQQFRFRLFTPELIREKLVEAAGEMKRAFENDSLYWIAREAGGSMRDAYTLFDQVLSFSEETITLAGIREKMGLVGLDSTTGLLEAASAGNTERALGILDEILTSGTAVEQVLVELADFLRNLTLMAYGIRKESILGLSPDRFPEGPRKAWDRTRLEIASEEAFSLFRDIRYSLNPRYELELFVGRLCSLTDRIDSTDLFRRIQALRKELTGGKWSGSDEGTPSEPKKKTPDDGRTIETEPAGNQEAERFFSEFRSPGRAAARPPEPEPEIQTAVEEAPCAVPVNMGTDSPEQRQAMLIGEIRRVNLTLASALEKAREWEWTDHSLLVWFDSSFEAALVKNETETLRTAAAALGLPVFSVETRTAPAVRDDTVQGDTSRVELIRRVFRGQIIKG
jgi:DNA polymerase-3 subunit gamma/tau